MGTLYVVVGDYFMQIYCVLPKRCVVKEISISKRWIRNLHTSYVFYVHPDEIEAITREFAAIGNNLNQIATFFNSGGIQSRAMHENINHAIACIFEMREQVAEMAGKNYGNLKAYRK